MKTFCAGHIEICFIDRRHLDLWGECTEDFEDFLRALTVAVCVSVDEDGVRTLFGGGAQRHRGMDSELARFVGCCRDYSALVPLSSDNNRFAFQGRIVELFH